MIVRIAAGLSLALGTVVLLAFLHALGKGPFAALEMRHLRDMKDRTAVPAAYVEYGYEEFARLPHGLNVAEYSALERQAVVLEGYVQRILRASDGDVHVEIVPAPDSAGTLRMHVTGEVTPAFARRSSRWSYAGLASAFRPYAGTTTAWSGGPRRARIGGWLLYDFQYDDSLGVWSRAEVPRMTGWEIHPITAIALFDDSLGRFVEYPR